MHAGHLGLARVASRILATPVAFELSVTNVDKPTLGEAEVNRRLRQFEWRHVVELTRAPTFREKARLFPGATFVVGIDTAERIAQPRYYGGSEAAMRAALDEIASRGCRFLVAGRVDGAGTLRHRRRGPHPRRVPRALLGDSRGAVPQRPLVDPPAARLICGARHALSTTRSWRALRISAIPAFAHRSKKGESRRAAISRPPRAFASSAVSPARAPRR